MIAGILARFVRSLFPAPKPIPVQQPKPTAAAAAQKCDRARAALPLWTWADSWTGRVVGARTKSEARAIYKAMYGLKRLPPGTIIRRAES